MDPNACYDSLIDALNEKRWEDATEHARNLWNWLVKGGFPPERQPIDTKNVPHCMHPAIPGYEPRGSGLLHLISGINNKLAESWEIRRDAVPDGWEQYTVYTEATGDRVATVFNKRHAQIIKLAPLMARALIIMDDAGMMRFSSRETARLVRDVVNQIRNPD